MSGMIKMKVAELSGKALDWVVAEVDGVKTLMMSPRKGEPKQPFALFGSLALRVGSEEQSSYAPSTCWHCGGPMIEKYSVWVCGPTQQEPNWCAWSDSVAEPNMEGDTPLIAICRAIVASKLGDTVSVPAELMP